MFDLFFYIILIFFQKSYITVLQKQVQGDFSSKFTYFDQLHAFLGKEIDPLGMREQG